ATSLASTTREDPMPLSEPRIVTRAPQPYAAIPLRLQQADIPQQAPPLVPEIMSWAERHAEQAGPVFFNYVGMAPGRPMEMEVGVPISGPAQPDGRVMVDTLPGGRYVSATWTGPYDGLRGAHEQLHEWLRTRSFQSDTSGGKLTLLEIYVTDP